MRMGRGRIGMGAAAVLVACALLEPSATSAAEPLDAAQLSAARATAEAGLKLYREGDYATALARFQAAEKIFHAPPHLLYIARSQEKLGRLASAAETYRKLLAETVAPGAPPQFAKAQSEGRAELDALEPRVPVLQVTVEGAALDEVEVTVGDRIVPSDELTGPVPVDPGEVRVRVKAPGRPEATAAVEAAEGAKDLTVILTVPGPVAEEEGDTGGPPADTEEQAGSALVGPLVLVGVGVVGAAVGAITGGLALSDASKLKDRCAGTICSTEDESLASSVRTKANISTVSFIVAGAAAAGGLLWLALVAGEDEPPSGPDQASAKARRSIEIGVGGPSLIVRGTF